MPQWRGIVRRRNDWGAMLALTGQRHPEQALTDLIGIDPLELPDVAEHIELFGTYANLGLTAIQPPRTHLRPGTYTEDIGRWHRSATLRLE